MIYFRGAINDIVSEGQGERGENGDFQGMIWSSIGVKNGDIRKMSFKDDPNYSLFIDQAIWIIIQVGKVHFFPILTFS